MRQKGQTIVFALVQMIRENDETSLGHTFVSISFSFWKKKNVHCFLVKICTGFSCIMLLKGTKAVFIQIEISQKSK